MPDPSISSAVDQYLKQKQQNTETELRLNLGDAVSKNPDYEAELHRAAISTGVPIDTARNLPDDTLRQAKLNAIDFQGLATNFPNTTKFLNQNADVAHDDIPTLIKLESIVKDITAQADLIAPKFFGSTARATGGVMSWVGAKMQESAGKPGYQYWKPLADQLRESGSDVRQTWDPIFQDPYFQPQTGGGKAVAFGGDIASMMGKAYLAAQTGGMAVPALFGAEGFGEAAGSALETGKTPTQAGWRGAGHGALNAALAFIPGGKFGGEAALGEAIAQGGKAAIAKELAKGVGVRVARGSVLGTGTTLGGNAINRATGDPATPWAQGLSENIASFIGMEGAGYLGHAVAAASESKLRARSPEAFRDAADSILKDSGMEQVMVDATKFQTFFQEQGLDPAKEAERIGVKNYTEALAAGTDVVIPTADFLAKVDPKHAEALLPDIRMQVGALTPREVEAYQVEASKVDLKAQAEPIDTGPQKAIYEETRAQLLDAGNSETVANTLADRHARVMVNLAKDFGQDPLALNERFGLRIYRPAPGEGQTPVDISLGRMGGAGGLDAVAAQEFNLDPAMDPRYWQGGKLNERLDALRQRLTLENGAENGNLHTVSAPGAGRGQGSNGTPRVGEGKALDAGGEPGIRQASGKEARSILDHFDTEAGQQELNQAEHVFWDAPKTAEFRSWNGDTHAYEVEVQGRNVSVRDPGPAVDEPRGWIRTVVLPNGDIHVRHIDAQGRNGSGLFMYQEAIKTAMAEFPEVTRDSMVIGDTSDAAISRRSRLGAGTDIHSDGTGPVSATPARNFLDYQSDPLKGKIKELGLDLGSATNEEVIAKLAEDPQSQTFFQPERSHPFDRQNPNNRPVVEMRDPNSLDYTEGQQNRVDQVRKDFPGDKYAPVVVVDGFGIIDGHNRTTVAKERGHKIPVVEVPNRVYEHLNGLEYDNMEISFAALSLAGERDAADSLHAQFPGAGIEQRGGQAEREWLDFIKQETYFQPMKRRTEDYKALRTRMASLRSLSPSHQAGELTRRALEAKIKEDEFLAWENGIKAVQAGEIYTGENRGFIQFAPDRKVSIALLEKANLTTFTHEVGHMYLEVMGDLASAEGASGPGVESYQKILDFVGVKDRSGLTATHHEKFARAMEAYAMEGKAPTAELKGAFQRVKFWMMQVYRSISDLGVRLNPEIRGVFDRMFAGEDAVNQAQNVVDLKPLFATAEDMKVTPAEFDAYSKATAKAIGSARDAVEAKLVREFTREKEAWWKDESAKVAEDVTAELDAEPVYQAFKILTDGKLEDGTPIKLNKDALEAQFGKGVGKDLPRSKGWAYAREGGMDAEAAAEILGFNSGDQLIEALRTMEPRKEAIKRLTQERMKERHGDMLTDGSLAESAVEALHNSAREDMLMAELRVLRAKQREAKPVVDELAKGQRAQDRADMRQAREALAVPPTQAFRDAAREIVDSSSIRDLQPYSYLTASRRAARESEAALLKKDYQAAGDAKQKEILNQHLYLEATKAREEASAIAEYGREGQTPKFQGKLGKAGADYRDQWNALATRYEFVKVPNYTLDARAQSLEAWVKAQEAAGEGIAIDPALYADSKPKNWREVPMAELRAVKDALKNIETVAKHQLGVTLEGKRLDFEAEAKDLDRVARENNGFTPTPRRGVKKGFFESAGSSLQGFNAYMQKMEWFINKLDGGDINGPARRNIKKPIDDASGHKKQMTEEVKGKLFEVFKDMTREERSKEYDSLGVQFPNMDRPINKLQAVSWLYNMGTEENRKVALLGEELVNPDGTFKPQVDALLGTPTQTGKFTLAEATRVQGTWDALGSMRPAIIAKETREKGYEPKWKKLTPFTLYTTDGERVEMKGGYYPLMADSDASNIGRRQDVPLAYEGTFTRPGVSSSHTIAVSGAVYPLLLDYPAVIGKHVQSVINNVTMGEAISYVSKFIMRDDVSTTIKGTIGLEREKEFLPWLQSVANDGVDPSNAGPIMNWLMKRRLGMSIARLGGNVTSYLVQAGDSFKLLAAGESADYLTHLYPQAMFDIARDPKATIDEIRRLSPNEMRFREQNGNREVRDILNNRSVIEENKQKVAEFVMSGFMAMDHFQTFPAWLGKFREGMAKHGDEAQAVMEADRLIARTFQAGEPRNLAKIMRGNEGMKLLTSFQGDANTWYGILSNAFEGQKVGPISIAIMALVAEQMVAASIRQGLPKKDNLGQWSIDQMITSFLNPFGPFGDFGQYGVSKLEGKYAQLNNPTTDAIAKLFALPAAVKDYHGGKKDAEGLAIDTTDAIGMWAGLPFTGQIVKSWRYQHNVRIGKQPKAPGPASEAWRTLTGPPAKENQ